MSHCKCDLNDEAQVKICISDLYNLLCALKDEDVNCNDINYVEGTDLLTDDLDLYRKSFCDFFLKTAKIEISEKVDNDESDGSSSHDISYNNKIALNHFIETLAFSIITASDSHGKDNSSQYASNYTKSQLKFIQLWNEFSNISYRNSEFSRTFTKIKPQTCSWVELSAGMSKIGKISVTLYPSRRFIKVTFKKLYDCIEWTEILRDQDSILQKLGKDTKYQSSEKNKNEIDQINRFIGVNFANNDEREIVFAEVAKYVVALRNVVVSYIK